MRLAGRKTPAFLPMQKRQSKTAASDYEIISLTTARLYLMQRTGVTVQDSIITILINSAESYLEESLGFIIDTSSLIYQYYDSFDTYLPIHHRYVTTTSFVVEYWNGSAWTAVSTSVYRTDLANIPPRAILKEDQDWPDISHSELNSVRVGFKVDTSVSFFNDLKAAVLTLVAARFENREGGDIPKTVKAFIDKYRIPA
jgi:hypothetical protein